MNRKCRQKNALTEWRIIRTFFETRNRNFTEGQDGTAQIGVQENEKQHAETRTEPSLHVSHEDRNQTCPKRNNERKGGGCTFEGCFNTRLLGCKRNHPSEQSCKSEVEAHKICEQASVAKYQSKHEKPILESQLELAFVFYTTA
jgi:hypothetical protein